MPNTDPLAVTLAITLVWAFRALAACAGAFVVFDWLTHTRHPVEFPPYNRHLNSLAWAAAGAGCIIAWFSYATFDRYLINPQHGFWPNVTLAATWGLLGGALVMRSVARAEEPRLIWVSAALIVVGGFVVLLLGGRPDQ